MTAPAVQVYGTEYAVTAVVDGKPRARAVRTQFGWHIPLQSSPVKPGGSPRRRWRTVPTAYDAAQLFYRMFSGPAAA